MELFPAKADIASAGMPLLEIDWWADIGQPVVITVIIGAVSIGLMMAALWVLDKCTSYSIHKELEEKQNVAVGIVVGAVAIGIAMVVASVARG